MQKAERRLGDVGAAHTTLVGALAEDPGNIDACKRLAARLIAMGDVPGVIALTDDLLVRGVACLILKTNWRCAARWRHSAAV